MSSITRRQVLASGAIAGLTASVPATVQAKLGDTASGRCLYCSADLAMGDLHWPGCIAVQSAAPSDSQIKPEAIKTAQAQQRSSNKPATRSQKGGTYGPEPCEQYNCDRCKIQKVGKAVCYHKNVQGCAVRMSC